MLLLYRESNKTQPNPPTHPSTHHGGRDLGNDAVPLTRQRPSRGGGSSARSGSGRRGSAATATATAAAAAAAAAAA
jgi:hypothetical protein